MKQNYLNSFKYKFVLHKAYFDFGYGWSSYFKYMIAIFGIASQQVRSTMIFFFLYGILCYVGGRLAYKFGIKEAEQEVENQYNLFCKELREKKKNQ